MSLIMINVLNKNDEWQKMLWDSNSLGYGLSITRVIKDKIEKVSKFCTVFIDSEDRDINLCIFVKESLEEIKELSSE